MRLKKLLFENNEDPEELNRLLQTEYKNDSKVLLYRQTNTVIDGKWEIKNIRGNRKPKGAPHYIQVLLDVIAKHRSKDIPLRKDSKFASTEMQSGYMFGSNDYIVFPEKNANIVSFPVDSVEYRSEIKWAAYFLNKDFDFDGYPVFKKFLEIASNFDGQSSDLQNFERFINKNWDDLVSERQEIYKEESSAVIDYIKKLFDGIHDYFNEMQRGIVPNSKEVMFDGSSYLIIEPIFFDMNFEWDGSKWELKNEI